MIVFCAPWVGRTISPMTRGSQLWKMQLWKIQLRLRLYTGSMTCYTVSPVCHYCTATVLTLYRECLDAAVCCVVIPIQRSYLQYPGLNRLTITAQPFLLLHTLNHVSYHAILDIMSTRLFISTVSLAATGCSSPLGSVDLAYETRCHMMKRVADAATCAIARESIEHTLAVNKARLRHHSL